MQINKSKLVELFNSKLTVRQAADQLANDLNTKMSSAKVVELWGKVGLTDRKRVSSSKFIIVDDTNEVEVEPEFQNSLSEVAG